MVTRSAILVLLAATFAWLGPARAQPKDTSASKFELGPKDRVLVRGGKEVAGLAYSPDGKLLAFAGGDTLVHLWDLQTNKELRTFHGHTGFIRTVVFSPDGKLLASAGDDPNVFIWDVATGKELRRVGRHKNNLRMAEFSPDGKLLVSSGFDNQIGLWDAVTGKQILLFDAHPRVPYSVAFSPDGKILASGGDHDPNIRLWDAATGKPIRSWPAHGKVGPRSCVFSVAFSPDGRLLASGGSDSAARVWEVATGKLLFTLDGHMGGVSKVVFATDGRTLLTASENCTAFLWEAATGQQIRKFGQHKRWVWGLACSPSQKTIATAGDDGAIVLWDIGAASAKELASRRELTSKELADDWHTLAGEDVRKAFDAGNRMSASRAEQIVPYLRERLHPAKPFHDADRVALLIGRLDHPMFRVREQATRDLAQMGGQIESLLRQALAKGPGPEPQRRIEALIATFNKLEMNPDELRVLRALRILEELNTPDARKFLNELASGAPDVRLTTEAAAATKRLSMKPGSTR